MHLSGFPVCLSSVFTGESRAAQDEQTASRPLPSVLLKGPLKAFCDSVSLSVTLCPKRQGRREQELWGRGAGLGASLEAPGGRTFCIRAPESLSDPRRLPPGPSSSRESRELASEGHLRRASWSLVCSQRLEGGRPRVPRLFRQQVCPCPIMEPNVPLGGGGVYKHHWGSREGGVTEPAHSLQQKG